MEEQMSKAIFRAAVRQVLPYTRSMMDAVLTKKIGTEKVFQESVQTLFEYMESGVDSPLSRISAEALSIQILGCLVEYLNAIDVPPTVTNLVQNLHLLDFAVSKQFPFYHTAKLLNFLVTSNLSVSQEFEEAAAS